LAEKVVKKIPDRLREFITLRAIRESDNVIVPSGKDKRFLSRRASEGNQGTMLKGTELAQIAPILEAIPDELIARKIKGMFSYMPKYQVLNLLISEKNEANQQFPNTVLELAEKLTEIDMKLEPMKQIDQ